LLYDAAIYNFWVRNGSSAGLLLNLET
jgi:hypothetical protein